MIFTFLVLFHIPIFIYYFLNTITPIQKFIFEELIKFGYSARALNPIKNNNKSKNKRNNDNLKKNK